MHIKTALVLLAYGSAASATTTRAVYRRAQSEIQRMLDTSDATPSGSASVASAHAKDSKSESRERHAGVYPSSVPDLAPPSVDLLNKNLYPFPAEGASPADISRAIEKTARKLGYQEAYKLEKIKPCVRDAVVSGNATQLNPQKRTICTVNDYDQDPVVQLTQLASVFVGVLPTSILYSIQPSLPQLIPISSESGQPIDYDILNAIFAPFEGAGYTGSQNTGVALVAMKQCIIDILERKIYPQDCLLVDANSPRRYMQDVAINAVQQFAGYLPPSLTQTLYNQVLFQIYAHPIVAAFRVSPILNDLSLAVVTVAAAFPTFSNAVGQANLCINNAIYAASAYSPGEAFTDVTQLPGCLATEVFTPSAVQSARLVQQAFGYLPAALVLDLQKLVAPAIPITQPLFDALFKLSGAGDKFAVCYKETSGCLIGGRCDIVGQCHF